MPHLVEAQAGIHRQLVGDLPFVLDVDAGDPSELRTIVGYGERRVDRIAERIERQHRRDIAVLRAFAGDRETRPQRMRVGELIGAVALQAVGEAAAVDVRSNAVEHKIADRVGDEVQRAVAGEGGELEVQPVDGFLQRQHAEGILLGLVLIEHRRVEIADAEGREPRRLARIVRDLESARGVAEDRAHARLRIEHRRGVAEKVALIGAIVDRTIAVGRVFDAEIAGEAAAVEEIFGVAAAPAVFEARRQGAETAAVNADAAALLQRIAALGLDVDDAGGAQAELRRQRAGDQRQAADETGIEHVTEAGNAIGQNDAVDPVLHVGVLVAHVDVAIDGAILRNAGRLQQAPS